MIDMPEDIMQLAKNQTLGERFAFESTTTNNAANKQLRRYL